VPQELSLSLPGENRAASRGLQKTKFSDPLSRRNVGEMMLLPILILVLTLSPVLIPVVATAFHLIANRRRNSRELVTVRGPIATLATDG
jgi:hypothetical protein